MNSKSLAAAVSVVLAMSCGGRIVSSAGGSADGGMTDAAALPAGEYWGCTPDTNLFVVCPEAQSCACNCPAQVQNCYQDEGCTQIVACAQKTGCQGLDCYARGNCKAVIDATGGPHALSESFALTLSNCIKDYFGCSFACAGTTGGPGQSRH